MKNIIALILSVFALASCSVQGTWNFNGFTAQHCYSDNSCATYYSVPGKVGACDFSVVGTLTFSGEAKGTVTEDSAYTVKCPGNPAEVKRILDEDLRYRIYREGGKAYIHYYKYGTTQQFILKGDSLTLVGKMEVDPRHFTARGLKAPAYVLLSYSYTRKEEKSSGPSRIDERLR